MDETVRISVLQKLYMKKSLLILFFAAIIGFAFNDPKKYTVTFIPEDHEKTVECFLIYKHNGQPKRVPAVVEGGKYKFEVEVDNYQKATVAYMVSKDGRMGAKNQTFVLEPGNLVIDKSTGKTIYSGTPLQEEMNSFYAIASDAWKKIFKEEQTVDLGDPVVKEKYRAFLKEKNVLWENYFEANKNPIVTAFNLENYVTNEWVNVEKADYFFSKLNDKVKNLPDIKQFYDRVQTQLAIKPGKQSPFFSLPDSTGNMVNLESFKGKYVLVDFWASWCKPCREESPFLVDAYSKYKEKGFEILSVSFDEQPAFKAWIQAAKKDQYTWTNVIDTAGMSRSSVAKMFNINMIPKNLLLDKNGVIVAVNLRGEGLEKELKQLFP
jgi:peroxiredoxin